MTKSLSFQKYFLLFVILISALKFIHLDADPPILKHPVDLYDEAWWAGNARLKILTDHWTLGDYSGGIAVAPLNSFITFLSFKTFGVNEIAIRIIPLMASLLILFLLFQLLKRNNLPLAKISVFLLSINYTFWVYSRLGHLEMTMTVFFLLAFIFFIKENHSSYLLASVSLFVAFLFKFSALIFYPVIFVYLILKLKSRSTTVQKVTVFLLSHLFFFIAFYFFFYLKHLAEFQTYLSQLHGKLSFLQQLNFFSITQKIIFLPLNNFFTEPSVCILSILALITLIKLIPAKMFFQKELFLKSEPLAIAVIWMLIYIPILFFTDYTPRRLNFLLIPITILAAYSVISFGSKENWNQLGKYAGMIAIFFLLFPAIGLQLNFHLLNFLPSSWFDGLTTIAANEKINSVLAIIFCLLFLIGIISGKLFSYQANILKFSSLVFVFILILNTVMIVNNRFEWNINKIFLLLIVAPFLILSHILLFTNNYTSITMLLPSYLILSCLLIAHDLIFPAFTRKEASDEIQRIIGSEKMPAIFFHNGWDAALTTKLLPLYYTAEGTGILPTKNVTSIRPEYFISSRNIDDAPEFFAGELNFAKSHSTNAVLLKEFSLFPVKNIAKENLLLYKLNYDD
ncbi:MAG: glycosyltransferase family 39 protein [Bacteroidia bacterium]